VSRTLGGLDGLAVSIVREAQAYLRPYVSRQSKLETEIGQITRQKGPDHAAYEFDDQVDGLIQRRLTDSHIGAAVFTEESGWFQLGRELEYIIVSDPFCNSALAMRGFRESAVTLCVLAGQNLDCCVVADVSSDEIFYADQSSTALLECDDPKRSRALKTSDVTRLSDAFVVVSALKADRRAQLARTSLLTEPAKLMTVDGGIMAARLAAGRIDAYADPFRGQPLYEAVVLELVQRAGGVVTDLEGRPFSLPAVVSQLRTDPTLRYKFVAACGPRLHAEIMATLA
jgi:fructose-1,6-bisphosphatase/inositol monophosphatase family enzyme